MDSCAFFALPWQLWRRLTVKYKLWITVGFIITIYKENTPIKRKNGNTYTNINKTRKIKRLRKRQRRQQRRVSRKYLTNKKGESYCKTYNIRKAEYQLLKLNWQLTNIRYNYLHQVTSEITNRKPMFVVLKDLKLSERLCLSDLRKLHWPRCSGECESETIRRIYCIVKTSAVDMYRCVSREFTPLECHINASSFGESGHAEEGMKQKS